MIGTWIRIGCSLNPEGYQPFKSVWYATRHVLLSHQFVGNKPGISEGFYICDRPWDLKWGPNRFFSSCHLEIWQMTSGNNREAIPCSEKLCVSYLSHPLIRIGVVIRKRSNRSQIINCTTWPRGLEIWPINNGASHLRRFELCVSFCSHLWIPTEVTAWKHPTWGTICYVVCNLDLWSLILTF